MTHAEKEIRNEEMRRYKAEGHTMKEVAEHFKVSLSLAHSKCRGIAPQKPIVIPTNKGIIKGDDEVASFIAERLDGFEYAGNYTGADGNADIRCKTCGTVTTRSMISIRHKKVACRECKRISRKRREAERKANKETLKWFADIVSNIKEQEIEYHKQEKDRKKEERRHPCPVCGAITTNKVCCSVRCSTKLNDQRKEVRRRARIDLAMVDEDISLKGLYKRDNGVCAICGGKCDWHDIDIRENVKVAGDKYPSVDHIVPLSKGGAYSWNNIQLAHRVCNSRKGNKPA